MTKAKDQQILELNVERDEALDRVKLLEHTLKLTAGSVAAQAQGITVEDVIKIKMDQAEKELAEEDS